VLLHVQLDEYYYPRLANWVKDQRWRKRKLDRGEPSLGMTAERAARLTALGCAWGRV
jgi:hypothetical protein